jgi:hypothetical protein
LHLQSEAGRDSGGVVDVPNAAKWYRSTADAFSITPAGAPRLILGWQLAAEIDHFFVDAE